MLLLEGISLKKKVNEVRELIYERRKVRKEGQPQPPTSNNELNNLPKNMQDIQKNYIQPGVDWLKDYMNSMKEPSKDGQALPPYKTCVPGKNSVCREGAEEVEMETIRPDSSASEYIHDFVQSDNKKFKGDSKQQRIKRALGAYYKNNKESMNEDDDPYTGKKYMDDKGKIIRPWQPIGPLEPMDKTYGPPSGSSRLPLVDSGRGPRDTSMNIPMGGGGGGGGAMARPEKPFREGGGKKKPVKEGLMGAVEPLIGEDGKKKKVRKEGGGGTNTDDNGFTPGKGIPNKYTNTGGRDTGAAI
jgi:hypothetical protein